MKTPKHLDGLVSVVTAVEDATRGTGYGWLIRSDNTDGYLANIYDDKGVASFPHHASTPAGALSHCLMEFNLRTKGNKP
jgi:hypothetical protein